MKKNTYNVISIILGLLVFTWAGLYGDDTNSGQPGAFLRLGYSARALGMGGAFTSIADDGSALLWNPAGLSQLKNIELTGMYSILSLGRQQNYASVSLPVSNIGTFGIGFIQYGVYDIDKRDEDGNPIGTFSDNEMAIIVGLGRTFHNFISYGASFSYLMHTIDESKANGIGFDVGVIAHDIFDMVNIGMSIKSLSSNLKWDNTGTKEEIPYVMKTGASIKVPSIPLIGSLDYEIIQNGDNNIHVGAQYQILREFLIRAGYSGDHVTAGCSFKIPIKNANLQIDYAYDPMTSLDFSDHKIGLRYIF